MPTSPTIPPSCSPCSTSWQTRYRLRPLLAVVAGTPAATPATAAAIVGGTRGGIVLDVSPRTDTPAAVAEAVVELGDLLGYVRVPARELDTVRDPRPARHAPAPGARGDRRPADRRELLASRLDPTGHGRQRLGPDGRPTTGRPDDPLTRLTAWRAAVDELLRHPQAV